MASNRHTRDALMGAYGQVQNSGFNFPYELKDRQIDVLLNIINGEHTLVVLPTGYGKSDLFILAPLLLNVLNTEISHISMVIIPTISLMADMQQKFTKRRVKICEIRHKKELGAVFTRMHRRHSG